MEEFRTNITKDFVGKKVTLKAWVANFRSSGKISFLQLRDGYGIIQAIVAESEVDKKVWDEVSKLTQESSVIVQGKISKHPKKE